MLKKILIVTKNIIIYAILILTILVVTLTIFGEKTNDGNVTFFGYETRIVISNSMEKCDLTDVSQYSIKDIPIKSMILIQEVPKDEDKKNEFYSQIKAGDVLTFKYVYTKQETITHRVIKINPNINNGYDIYLKGDNKTSQDGGLTQYIDTSDEESFNYVIGKVKKVNVGLGYLAYALQNPIGLICIIIVPCGVLIIWEIVKIILLYKNDKVLAKQEELSQKDKEIQRLTEQIKTMQEVNQINKEGSK